eukprot:m.352787 g.352787  ORF g.352787 m.352787 type:complete len:361 (-) comp20712_c0_seq2:1080-2162(-)
MKPIDIPTVLAFERRSEDVLVDSVATRIYVGCIVRGTVSAVLPDKAIKVDINAVVDWAANRLQLTPLSERARNKYRCGCAVSTQGDRSLEDDIKGARIDDIVFSAVADIDELSHRVVLTLNRQSMFQPDAPLRLGICAPHQYNALTSWCCSATSYPDAIRQSTGFHNPSRLVWLMQRQCHAPFPTQPPPDPATRDPRHNATSSVTTKLVNPPPASDTVDASAASGCLGWWGEGRVHFPGCQHQHATPTSAHGGVNSGAAEATPAAGDTFGVASGSCTLVPEWHIENTSAVAGKGLCTCTNSASILLWCALNCTLLICLLRLQHLLSKNCNCFKAVGVLLMCRTLSTNKLIRRMLVMVFLW